VSIQARYDRLACIMVLLGVCSYATAAGSLPIAAAAAPIVIGAWWATSGKRRLLLPRLVVNLLLAGVVALALFRAFRGHVTVDALAELVLLLLLVKLGDRRGPRDDAQLMSMSVFLGIAAMLTSNEFWVGVQIIALVPVTAVTVMLHQIRAGQEGAVRVPPPGRGFAVHLRALSASSVIGAGIVAAMVFVLMPRGIGQDRFGNWGIAAAGAVSGFTDQVRLTGSGIISQSSEVVMTLQVRTSGGVSLGGADTIHYLRGAVLEQYEGGVWARNESRGPGWSRDVAAGEEAVLSRGIGSTVDQSITLRGLGRREDYIFAEWKPVKIVFKNSGRLRADEATQSLRASATAPGRFEYTVSSSPADPPGPAPAIRTPLAPVEGPIADLARRVLAAGGVEPDPAGRPIEADAQAARVIQDHLREGYTYTLETATPPEGRDPIEWFLFDRRQGHCELYAAAMVQMCRAAGINARMVAGYVAAEYNAAADQYIVRASNAHAWVEVEVGQGRWRRFDPTPTSDLARIHRPALGVFGRVRQWLDAVEFAWNRSIVSFDELARSRVIGTDQAESRGMIGRMDAFLARLRAGGPRVVGRAVGVGIAVFAGVAGAGGIVVLLARGGEEGSKARRAVTRRGPFIQAGAAKRVNVRFYGRMLDALRRRGLTKPAWRPPLDHARALAARGEAVAESVASLASLYYAVRFGGMTLGEAERRAAEQEARRLGQRL
jgi:transglutaminase-like putative cysteine protease